MRTYVPTREQYREYAARGNLIPVYREVLADGDTPVSVYAKLGACDHSFLLESVIAGEQWAAHSFIGVAPRLVFRATSDRVLVTRRDVEGGGPDRESTFITSDPLATLADLLGEFRPEPPLGLPHFFGGAVGYFGFDLCRPRSAAPRVAGLGLPACYLVVSDTLLAFDNLRQTVKVVANSICPSPAHADAAYDAACARIDALCAQLAAPAPRLKPLELEHVGPVPARATLPRQDFLAAVAAGRDHIRAGNAYQLVLSQRFELERGGVDPLDLYRGLRAVYPSPYMFHLQFPECAVTGASPECMVRLDGDVLEMRPFSGRRPRGRDDEEDDRLADELLADGRARADHVLLVDTCRADLGRVAATGSIEVDEFMAVEGGRQAMHLVSTLRGHLAPGRDALQVLRATFPAATHTGAPKARASEIVGDLEATDRGVYGGAIGFISFTGTVDLAVAGHTLVTRGDRIYVQAGARVRHDSDPDLAYDATVADATAVVRAVAMAKGV
jgi:anthranilate synthase component 1